MEAKTNVKTESLIDIRKNALREFSQRANRVGKCFEMPVYQLNHIRMTNDLKSVVGNSNRAIWILENVTLEIPEQEKVWEDAEILSIWSFDSDVILAASERLKEVIHRNLREALKMVMDKSSKNRILVYNFGDDMNSFIWEECFRNLFISEDL